MAESVRVELSRRELGDELVAVLEPHGLAVARVDIDEGCQLEVSFAADERNRLLGAVEHAIEGWLGDHQFPLVATRTSDGYIVRPPAA